MFQLNPHFVENCNLDMYECQSGVPPPYGYGRLSDRQKIYE